ncbi:hypothetical protein ONZ51_g2989 [Trametes cubensis]|uniref:Uncharacterized protein n=1 Tax=Trametes cubensis TaxID=1111947 RepID=A0AAD7XDF2_9APHY|nr:hypothetical protein ONZ51_g2989 [Trametes cubensis]
MSTTGAAADIRFSRSYIRLLLLPPEELAIAIARDPSTYSMRNLCIQAQRLEVQSKLSIFAYRPKTPGYVPSNYKIVLAPWCLANLQDLGYTISVDTPLAAGESTLVLTQPRANTPQTQSRFLLLHRDGGIMTIAITLCPPRRESLARSLHVTVSWGKADPAYEVMNESNIHEGISNCGDNHADRWIEGQRCFQPPLELMAKGLKPPAVTLRLIEWEEERTRVAHGMFAPNCYAIDVSIASPSLSKGLLVSESSAQ